MKIAAVVALALSLALGGSLFAARTLDIYFIDVEGGESTLIVTPAGESMLIDAGYSREGRDPARIMAAIRDAGLEKIDYLLITHFHPDHAGGVPELATRIPIGTFIDYGAPLGTPYGADRMSTRTFEAYATARAQGAHLRPQPGDRLPLKGVAVDVVSAGGDLLPQPLDGAPGAGQENAGCGKVEDFPADGTENYRSVGVLLTLGAFRFLDVGDLSGNTLAALVCPRNLVGHASVYLVSHHGDYDTSIPAVYTAIRPRVAVMNNGVVKGGSPDAFKTLRAVHGLEDLWQLHASRNDRVQNAPDAYIANIDGAPETEGHWIKLSASDDGSFRVVNTRTGFGRSYPPAR